jgi:hypothetical protein
LFPAPTPDTIYAIFVPPVTEVTLQGGTSCFNFGAYHNSTRMSDGTKIAYAVMPRCGGLDDLTYSASHEFIEAASDPYPSLAPAYSDTDDAHLAWSLFAGGEIGDLCEFNPDAPFMPQNYPWTVTHGWSNEEAFLGHDPCAPSKGPYFVAIPDQPDIIHLFGNGSPVRGIQMSPNDIRQIPITMHGFGMNGSWSVSAQDGTQMKGGSARLTFSFNPTSGKDGDTLTMTIKKLSNSTGLQLELFVIRASNGSKTTLFWGATGAN